MTRDDRPPGFFVYILDLVADGKVEVMTTEEFGAYMLLLFKSWFEDPPASIPDDDYTLSRWARLASDRWTECKTRVLAPFRLGTDSRWHQKRLRKEFELMRERQKKKSKAATTAANSRWGRDDARRIRDAVRTQCERNAKSCLSSSLSTSSTDLNIYFAEFWQAWPRKEAPDPALDAFRKLAPDRKLLDEMLGWIERACQSEQWQQTKFIPLPAKFLRQKLWKGDPPPLASNPHRDTIGAEDSCAQNPKFQCNFCEDTGRLVVLFHNENGKGTRCLGAWPWSEDREERLGIAKKADSRVFRCACQAGEPFEQLETWTPDMGE